MNNEDLKQRINFYVVIILMLILSFTIGYSTNVLIQIIAAFLDGVVFLIFYRKLEEFV